MTLSDKEAFTRLKDFAGYDRVVSAEFTSEEDEVSFAVIGKFSFTSDQFSIVGESAKLTFSTKASNWTFDEALTAPPDGRIKAALDGKIGLAFAKIEYLSRAHIQLRRLPI